VANPDNHGRTSFRSDDDDARRVPLAVTGERRSLATVPVIRRKVGGAAAGCRLAAPPMAMHVLDYGAAVN
jgi:hypothetical protein